MKLRFDIKQNTDEWFEIKIGKISASSAECILMDKNTKGYQDLIDRLVEERMTGKPSESKTFQGNQYTERGHEFEPIASDDFELNYFCEPKIIGVIELNEHVLCSPDRIIDDNKLLQIKCPIFNTQKKYLKKLDNINNLSDNKILQKLDSKYYKQVQFELFVSGFELDYWYSYHPELPHIKLDIIPDKDLINRFTQRVNEINIEVEQEINFLKSIKQ